MLTFTGRLTICYNTSLILQTRCFKWVTRINTYSSYFINLTNFIIIAMSIICTIWKDMSAKISVILSDIIPNSTEIILLLNIVCEHPTYFWYVQNISTNKFYCQIFMTVMGVNGNKESIFWSGKILASFFISVAIYSRTKIFTFSARGYIARVINRRLVLFQCK